MVQIILSKPILKKFAPNTFAIAEKRWNQLKNREIHPEGTFDKGGRWYPDMKLECCNVRSPSRAYPYSLMLHCRSWEHVCNEYYNEFAAEILSAYHELLKTPKKRYTKAENEILSCCSINGILL